MSDGAGGPIIEPGGQGHFHGGSDVIAKKVQVKTFVKVILMINKNTWRQGGRDKSSHWSFHDLYVASPDPPLVPEQHHFLSCLYGDQFQLILSEKPRFF